MSTKVDGQRAMAGTNEKLTAPLTNLLNPVGSTLKPKVFCVRELAHQGARHPGGPESLKGIPDAGYNQPSGLAVALPIIPLGTHRRLQGCTMQAT